MQPSAQVTQLVARRLSASHCKQRVDSYTPWTPLTHVCSKQLTAWACSPRGRRRPKPTSTGAPCDWVMLGEKGPTASSTTRSRKHTSATHPDVGGHTSTRHACATCVCGVEKQRPLCSVLWMRACLSSRPSIYKARMASAYTSIDGAVGMVRC